MELEVQVSEPAVELAELVVEPVEQVDPIFAVAGFVELAELLV